MHSSSEFTALQHYPFLSDSGVGNLTRALGELNRLCHIDVAGFYSTYLIGVKELY